MIHFMIFHLFRTTWFWHVFTTYQLNTQESIQKSHVINSLLMCLLFQLYVYGVLFLFSIFSSNDHRKSTIFKLQAKQHINEPPVNNIRNKVLTQFLKLFIFISSLERKFYFVSYLHHCLIVKVSFTK